MSVNKRIIAALIAVIILVAASVTACTLLRSSVKENETTVPSGTQTDEAYIKVNGTFLVFRTRKRKLRRRLRIIQTLTLSADAALLLPVWEKKRCRPRNANR